MNRVCWRVQETGLDDVSIYEELFGDSHEYNLGRVVL